MLVDPRNKPILPPEVNNSEVIPAPDIGDPRKRDQKRYALMSIFILVIAIVLVNIIFDRHIVGDQSAQVSVTSSQFVPATIEVSPDTTIIWANADTQVHEIAADPFPKDNSIPDFNSKVLLQPNNTLSFTFLHKGTYTYHDELYPFALKGTVIVK